MDTEGAAMRRDVGTAKKMVIDVSTTMRMGIDTDMGTAKKVLGYMSTETEMDTVADMGSAMQVDVETGSAMKMPMVDTGKAMEMGTGTGTGMATLWRRRSGALRRTAAGG